MRAATATDIEDSGEIPVPFSINTRTNATICRATKKKIVGGSNAKNSSLSLLDSLDMELNCDERCSFHVSCFRTWLGRMRRASVLDLLLANLAPARLLGWVVHVSRPAVDHVARPDLVFERRWVVGMARVFHRVEVVEVTEEF